MTTKTLNGTPVAAHECDEFDCEICKAAELSVTLPAKAKKFAARKRKASVIESARPTGRTITHVAGDVPVTVTKKVTLTEMESGVRYTVGYVTPGGQATVMVEGLKGEAANGKVTFVSEKEADTFVDAVKTKGWTKNTWEYVAPLQQPLSADRENFVAAPSHLSSATVAKGFILAGNAYFTVRSKKTGTRYTYRVSRAACSRCKRLDCQCWKYPTYFVALLTGPDNTEDYSYLGILRENAFQLTRASKMNDASLPVRAFRWVWDALAKGAYPGNVEIWHEGRCGRCGRTLTVPESVERGIGPDCAGKMGV